MTAALVASCAVVGLVVGSFLNVVAWRLPRGESVVRPRSRCPGCRTTIASRDNVPLLSWLLLRGRCRHCATRIPARYPVVEAVTGGLFAVLAARFGATAVLPAFLYLAAVGVALTVIDLDLHRLPDALTLPSYLVGAALLGAAAAAGAGHTPFLRALAGMAALYSFYLLLRLVHPGGMGGGDVKLAGVVGLYLAWLGWGAVVVGTFTAFLTGGVVGLGLIAWRGASRKSRIPFGPFMLLGALVGVLVGQHLFHLYTAALG